MTDRVAFVEIRDEANRPIEAVEMRLEKALVYADEFNRFAEAEGDAVRAFVIVRP